MEKFILSADKIFTNDEKAPFIEGGAVLICDGMVEKVGRRDEIVSENMGAREEVLKKGLLTPGLVNLHHHLYSSFARGWTPTGKTPKNFKETLERVWWRLDEELNLEDIFHSAITGLTDSLLCGVTTVVDHHSSQRTILGSLSKIEEAYALTGVRGSVCFEMSDRAGKDAFASGLEETLNALKRHPFGGKGSTLTALTGMHASMTLSDESLLAIRSATAPYSCGYHFHLAEDKIDIESSLKKFKARPVARFEKHGLLNDKSLAIHGVHLNKKEAGLLKKKGANLVICPRSNQNNAVGFPPFWNYGKLRTGLGTDGIGSDIINEAKSALYIARQIKKEPSFGFALVSEMLLKNNPEIFEKITGVKTGTIARGYRADMVLWNYDSPTPIVADNICGHYLYGLCNERADSVWVDGTKVLESGRFTNFDHEGALRESRKLAKALWARL